MSDNIAIGIDLGTTSSRVAVYNGRRVNVCMDDSGKDDVASYVYFTEKEILVGNKAKDKWLLFNQNTIYDVKRLIGREFDDPFLEDGKHNWPFNIIEEKGRLKIQIKVKTDIYDNYELKSFFPEDITKMILEVLKWNAECYIGCKVKYAVITVPTYFNDAQRLATKYAASLAGLTVLQIVDEPMAAAIAYGFDMTDRERYFLVFDLGRTRFDVTILKVYNRAMRVIATGGDQNLGGDDFHNSLLDYCTRRYFKEEIYGETREGKRSLFRLRNLCENAKITLSKENNITIGTQSLYKGNDICVNIPKARFESINNKLFDKCMDIVDECVKSSKLDPDKLELVLVGGSTRIPKIRNMLQKKYPGMTLNLNKIVNPEEAVSHGAAILAENLMQAKSKEIQADFLQDETPLSLGAESKGEAMGAMIPTFSEIPIKKSNICSTTKAKQELKNKILIKVYEGERTKVEDIFLLGEFEIKNISVAPRGHVKVGVTFEINANNKPILTAVENISESAQCFTITDCKGELFQKDVDHIYKDEETYRMQYMKKKHAIIAKYDAITYFENLKIQLSSSYCKKKLSNDQIIVLNKKLDDAIDFVVFNTIEDEKVYNDRRQELESFYVRCMGL